jgi:translation initiation factor IF-3
MAREANLDPVEVAPNERPPVCKIMDYGSSGISRAASPTSRSSTSRSSRRSASVPKRASTTSRPRSTRRALEHKDRVLINVLFRGRELQHIEEGQRIIAGMLEKLVDVSKIEKAPSMEGRRMVALLAPKGT